MTSKSAVLYGPRDLRIEARPTPDPAAHEVLVQVIAVGICGSDIHYYFDGRLGGWSVDSPMILGHETSGIVVALGSATSRHRIGDRVALEPGVPCMHCETCLGGRYNLCDDVYFYSHPPNDGTLAEYVVIDEYFAHPMPATMSFDDAALIEPYSVGMWAVARAKVRPGDAVLVTGAGPIGLMALLAARTAGAASVVVADIAQARLDVATERGASAVIDVSVQELTDSGQIFNAFIECSGNARAMSDGIKCLRKGGRAVAVGLGPQTEFPLPVFEILAREIEVTGGFRYANTWPTALKLIDSGVVNLGSMISAHFSLDDCAAALEAPRADPRFLKSVVRPTEQRE